METSMDKWKDTKAAGEGAPSLTELLCLHSSYRGCKGGLGGSRTKAAFREEPPSRATQTITLRSKMHLGMWWGAAAYKGFAVCWGQRRKLRVKGGEYRAHADKVPEMQQKKWKKKKKVTYGRGRALLIALVKCKHGRRKHDVCWQWRKSSQNQCILAVTERTVFRAITFPQYTPV